MSSVNLTKAFMDDYFAHSEACALAQDHLDSSVMGACPYCSELHARSSAAMNSFLDEHPPLLGEDWAQAMEGYTAYRRNNPRTWYDDIERYREAPPLPDGVEFADLPQRAEN